MAPRRFRPDRTIHASARRGRQDLRAEEGHHRGRDEVAGRSQRAPVRRRDRPRREVHQGDGRRTHARLRQRRTSPTRWHPIPPTGSRSAQSTAPTSARSASRSRSRRSPKSPPFRVAAWNVCSEACGGYSSPRPHPVRPAAVDSKVDMFGLQESGGGRVGQRHQLDLQRRPAEVRARQRAAATPATSSTAPRCSPSSVATRSPIGHGRYTTWAAFRVNSTGREFIFVNIHLLTGKSGVDGKRASRDADHDRRRWPRSTPGRPADDLRRRLQRRLPPRLHPRR